MSKKTMNPAMVLMNAAERLKRQHEIEEEFNSETQAMGEKGRKLQALFDEWKKLKAS